MKKLFSYSYWFYLACAMLVLLVADIYPLYGSVDDPQVFYLMLGGVILVSIASFFYVLDHYYLRTLTLAWRSPHMLPLSIGVAGLVLRFWSISKSQFWYDEAFTYLAARLPFAQMMDALMGDVHPPLWYLLMMPFARTAAPELFMRSVAALLSTASLYVFWLLTADLSLPRPQRIAALCLLAFLPVSVYYGQEARMYALLELFTLLQFLFLLRKRWLPLALVTLLSLYTHNYALVYSAVIGLIGLIPYLSFKPLRLSRASLPLFLSLGLPLILWLPWAWVLIGQLRTIGTYWIMPLTPGNVIYSLVQMLVGINIFEPLLPVTCGVVAFLLISTLAYSLKARRWMLLSLAFGPLALVVIISLFKPILLFRALIGSLPFLLILFIQMLSSIRLRDRAVVVALALPVFLLTGFWQMELNQVGLGKMAKPLPVPADPSSLVIHSSTGSLLVYTTYPPAPGVKQSYLSLDCPIEWGGLSQRTRAALGFVPTTLAQLPPDYFFVGLIGPYTSACSQAQMQALTARFPQPLEFQQFPLGFDGVWHVR